jgi:nucleoid-associated protein YgaU
MPPELPERYHPLVEESTRSLVPAAPHRPRTLQVAEPRVRIRRVEEEPAPPRERTHRIVDGDTLEKIAQRYWQDASLADALYAANRDQLATPDPLPLGKVLRIPAAPSAAQATSETAPQVEELPAPVRQPQAELKLDEPLVPFPRASNN